MTSVVIASAARTPVGSFNGAFANVPAHELGAAAIRGALASNIEDTPEGSRWLKHTLAIGGGAGKDEV